MDREKDKCCRSHLNVESEKQNKAGTSGQWSGTLCFNAGDADLISGGGNWDPTYLWQKNKKTNL